MDKSAMASIAKYINKLSFAHGAIRIWILWIWKVVGIVQQSAPEYHMMSSSNMRAICCPGTVRSVAHTAVVVWIFWIWLGPILWQRLFVQAVGGQHVVVKVPLVWKGHVTAAVKVGIMDVWMKFDSLQVGCFVFHAVLDEHVGVEAVCVAEHPVAKVAVRVIDHLGVWVRCLIIHLMLFVAMCSVLSCRR